MQVLMMANSKGGVGKSTLATNLVGTALELELKVLMIDLDRQKSLDKWSVRHGGAVPCITKLPGGHRGLARLGRPDVVVIDTPAGIRGEGLDRVLSLSDMIIVPTGATLVDLEATRKFIQRLRRRKKLIKGRADLITVLNRLRPGTAVAAAEAEAERQLGAPVAAWLPNAKAFEDQMAAGGFVVGGRYANMGLVAENLRRILALCGV